MSQQSPIFVKTEAFMVWLLEHTRKYPRYERFRLAQHIDNALFAFHESLLWAVKSENPQSALKEADLHLERLRAYLRIAVELHYTSPSQYEYIAEQVTEIGKLLGGWIKKA